MIKRGGALVTKKLLRGLVGGLDGLHRLHIEGIADSLSVGDGN